MKLVSSASMTSRDRIKRTFEFKAPDRVGIFDDLTDGAVRRWRNSGGLPEGAAAQEYFDFDIRLFGFDQSFRREGGNIVSLERINKAGLGENLRDKYENTKRQEKFLALGCMEPFEHISRAMGREKTLTMMAEEANKAASLFSDSSEFTLNMCQLLLDKGYRFDGAWLWGDLGYGKGLMFSTDYYNAFLFDLHKEFCDFFAKNGMPVIFHSDGNITELIPHIIEAGIRAIEPVESNSVMDVVAIKREYGKDLVIFGGIDERTFTDRNKAEKEIRSKFKRLMRGGGYIYHADSPILEETEFDDYRHVIEAVKRYGTYGT